jgi:hypothetical protein
MGASGIGGGTPAGCAGPQLTDHAVPVDQQRRWRTRSTRSRALALLLASTVAACSPGGPSRPVSTDTASPAPTTTTPSGAVSQPSTAAPSTEPASTAVAAAVRDYFDAFDKADFAALESHSAGELITFARWLRILDGESYFLGGLSPAAATIDSLTVLSIRGHTATVNIRGQLDETAFDPKTNDGRLTSSNISGPVTLLQRATTWQVVDYRRGGRSVRDQIYPIVRGQQTSQGVTVKVVGVDLRPTGTVLVLETRNTTALDAGAESPTIEETSGRRHPTGLGNVLLLEVKRRSTTRHALFFPTGLPRGTTGFQLRTDYDLGCNPVCKISTSFDIPVQLVR